MWVGNDVVGDVEGCDVGGRVGRFVGDRVGVLVGSGGEQARITRYGSRLSTVLVSRLKVYVR